MKDYKVKANDTKLETKALAKTMPMSGRTVTGKKRAKGLSQSKIAEILERYKLGQSGTKIAKEMGLTVNSVYSVKKRYKEDLNNALTIKNKINIDNYEDDLTNNLKRNILLMSNRINNYDLNKVSINQLVYAMGIMFDKLRLIEGKSTSNVAHQVIDSLDSNQLEIIKDSIKSLKESMLKD